MTYVSVLTIVFISLSFLLTLLGSLVDRLKWGIYAGAVMWCAAAVSAIYDGIPMTVILISAVIMFILTTVAGGMKK